MCRTSQPPSRVSGGPSRRTEKAKTTSGEFREWSSPESDRSGLPRPGFQNIAIATTHQKPPPSHFPHSQFHAQAFGINSVRYFAASAPAFAWNAASAASSSGGGGVVLVATGT